MLPDVAINVTGMPIGDEPFASTALTATGPSPCGTDGGAVLSAVETFSASAKAGERKRKNARKTGAKRMLAGIAPFV